MSYAWAALGGALAMALIEWLWTRDWSPEEVDTDLMSNYPGEGL